jgi:hypothetical protein
VKISLRKEKKETLSLSSSGGGGESSFPFGQKGNPIGKDKTNHISNYDEEWGC